MATAFHILWCHIFVIEWGLGMQGIGLANTLSSVILLLTLVLYTMCQQEVREALYWPNSSVWDDWKEYLALGIPSTGILWAEYTAWQVLIAISTLFGV